MTKKTYAFFAHFNRINMQRGKPKVWSVHFRGTCHQATALMFKVPLHTRYLPNGAQPRATIRGKAAHIRWDGDTLVIG